MMSPGPKPILAQVESGPQSWYAGSGIVSFTLSETRSMTVKDWSTLLITKSSRPSLDSAKPYGFLPTVMLPRLFSATGSKTTTDPRPNPFCWIPYILDLLGSSLSLTTFSAATLALTKAEAVVLPDVAVIVSV